MAVKLTDVAKLAGVSPTTVSRVINRPEFVSQATCDKVHRAMKELNYMPNLMARTLQGKATRMIGVIMPTITNPFYAELVEKIEKSLFKKGYRMLLCDSAEDSEKESAYVRLLIANQVDGIIAGSHNLDIAEYEQIQAPVLSFDRYLATNIPIVGSDNYAGGQLATQLLLDKGCQRVAIFLGTSDSGSPTDNRLKGYQDALAEHGQEPIIYHFPHNQDPIIKQATIKQILTTQVIDGIFCTDDLTALLTYNIAKSLGIEIPKHLRIVGYDGTELMRHYFPYITTIQQPIRAYAEQLVTLLMAMLAGEEVALKHEFPVTVWVGETC